MQGVSSPDAQSFRRRPFYPTELRGRMADIVSVVDAVLCIDRMVDENVHCSQRKSTIFGKTKESYRSGLAGLHIATLGVLPGLSMSRYNRAITLMAKTCNVTDGLGFVF